MNILGIDYGDRKTGIAISTSPIAEPLLVIREDNSDKLIRKINLLVSQNKIDLVIVGISEGKRAKVTQVFIRKLKDTVNCDVRTQDETLTTYEAQSKSLQSNISRTKRKNMEDAYSAAIILQEYLDNN